MAAVTENVIRRLTIIAKQEGLEALKSELSKVTQEFDRTGASTLSVAKKLDTLERAVDPAAKAQAILVAGLRTVSKAMNENVVDADRAARVISLLGEKYEGLAAKAASSKSIGDVLGEHYKQTQAMNAQSASMVGRLDAWSKANEKVAETNQKVTNSLGLTKMQAISMQQTIGDVIASAATGQSPLRILLQQGEQALQPYGTGLEGIKAAASATFGVVTKLVNPITAVGGAMIATAYATYRWQKQTDELVVSLNGLGKLTGMSISQARGIADANANGLSLAQARDYAGQYLAAGVPGRALGGAIGTTRDFGAKMGLSGADAASTLARALSDPARGAQDLAQKFGLLSYAQREEIAQLQAMGDRSGAAAKLIADVKNRLAELKDPTWGAAKGLEFLKNKASDLLDVLAKNNATKESFSTVAGRIVQGQKDANRGHFDEALNRQLGLDKLASDASFAAREITAETYAQREAVEMEKARVNTLRDTKDATAATMAAEAARLQLLAEAERKVNDYARSGARERAISGAMTPYERQRQQIIEEGRELERQIPASTTVTRPTQPRHKAAPAERHSGINDLMAEAERRGMEPTDANFQKLMDEGVGRSSFRGRLINMNEDTLGAATTVNVPNVNRGALVRNARAETQARLNALQQNEERAFTTNVNRDIESQTKLLEKQADAFGKDTEELARATKQQELLNQVKEQGLPETKTLIQSIDEEARKYGELAAKQEGVTKTQRDVVRAMDDVRNTGKDALGGLINDLRQGQRFGDALAHSLDGIASKLINIGLDKLFEGALGENGKTGGGLSGGGLFNFIKNFFADGGIMTSRGSIPLRKYADGGVASSPQLALFGEGSGPEAYVPLKDGGIPVHIKAAANQGAQQPQQTVVAPKTEVHVHNAPPGSHVKESQNSNGTRRMDVMIAEATASSASNPMVRGAFRSANAVVRR